MKNDQRSTKTKVFFINQKETTQWKLEYRIGETVTHDNDRLSFKKNSKKKYKSHANKNTKYNT